MLQRHMQIELWSEQGGGLLRVVSTSVVDQPRRGVLGARLTKSLAPGSSPGEWITTEFFDFGVATDIPVLGKGEISESQTGLLRVVRALIEALLHGQARPR